MGQSLIKVLIHLVFSTKGREPLIEETIRPRLFAIIGGIIKDNSLGEPISINGVSDHIHILMSLRSTVRICDALRLIKCNSSGWIHKTFPNLSHFAWQAGYGAFSIGESQRQTVIRYIERQEEHHRRHSYQTEMRSIVERYGVEYDERYWLD